MNSKTLIGCLVAGILCFFLGWLVYGILLFDYGTLHYNHCMDKGMEEFTMWAMIVSNLAWGALIAVVLFWSGSWDFMSGAKAGGFLGLMSGIGINMQFYAMTNMFTSIKVVALDVLIGTLFVAVIGGLTAVITNKLAK